MSFSCGRPVDRSAFLLKRCGDEAYKQRMRFIGAALEFRVELDADEERPVRDFDRLHQQPVGRKPAYHQTGCARYALFTS